MVKINYILKPLIISYDNYDIMFAIPCYLPQLMMLDTEEKYAYLVKHAPKAKTPSVKIIIKAKVFKIKKVSMPFASPAVQHAYTLCLKVG
jgi:hypothetical protein